MFERLGFKVATNITQIGQQTFPDLLSVNSEASQEWTLHLNALRYQNGPLALGAAQPADNQVNSLVGSVPPSWKANILMGAGDGSENIVVDYYARGCTIPLHGAFIRVAISGLINTANVGLPSPILSGFLVPFQRSSPLVQSPTYTPPQFILAAGATRLFPLPDRATAYRIIRPFFGAQLLTVSQVDATSAIPVQFDFPGAGAPSSASQAEQSNLAGYAPLNPATQFIAVNNADAAPQQVGLQFLLDLC